MRRRLAQARRSPLASRPENAFDMTAPSAQRAPDRYPSRIIARPETNSLGEPGREPVMIASHFSPDEIENLVRTAAEAVCGQPGDLSTRQLDLATRAYALLTGDDTPASTASAPNPPDQPAIEVWVLRHDDKHGDDISLYASRACAWRPRSNRPQPVGQHRQRARRSSNGGHVARRGRGRNLLPAPDRNRKLHALQRPRRRRPQHPPHGLLPDGAETLITLATITAAEHHNRPDQGSTACLRAPSEPSQGPTDAAEIYDRAGRVLTQIATSAVTYASASGSRNPDRAPHLPCCTGQGTPHRPGQPCHGRHAGTRSRLCAGLVLGILGRHRSGNLTDRSWIGMTYRV